MQNPVEEGKNSALNIQQVISNPDLRTKLFNSDQRHHCLKTWTMLRRHGISVALSYCGAEKLRCPGDQERWEGRKLRMFSAGFFM